MSPTAASSDPSIHILDVRADTTSDGSLIRQQLIKALRAPPNQKTIPTVLLYDEIGLKLYDRITTHAEEYYPYLAEQRLLESHAEEMVDLMHAGRQAVSGEVIIELGAGSLRKTSHVLHALAKSVAPQQSAVGRNLPVTYFALDLEEKELLRTLKQVYAQLGDTLAGKVEAKGMLGTYDDGIRFVQTGGLLDIQFATGDKEDHSLQFPNDKPPCVTLEPKPSDGSRSSSTLSTGTPFLTPSSSLRSSASLLSNGRPETPVFFMFLGSSLGNFCPSEGSSFLKKLPLRPGSGDKLLLGLDHTKCKSVIERAYNDRDGLTRDFILNGLRSAGRILGNESVFHLEDGSWAYSSFYNESKHRHEAYYRSTKNQNIEFHGATLDEIIDISFLKDELVHVEYSYKYSTEDMVLLFSDANLRPINRWVDDERGYSVWLLERPPFHLPLLSESGGTLPGPFSYPTLRDFQDLWKMWDFITLKMIPTEMLHKKPIDLRHICLFYLGHIPTFLDIHLSRYLNEPHTEPEKYKDIFERGIDPNVEDPSLCHAHSNVPEAEEDWPELEEILTFRDQVRARLIGLYGQLDNKQRQWTRKIARVLSMTFEHEQIHAETLCYMLIQGFDGTPHGTLSPPSFSPPCFELLARRDKQENDVFLGHRQTTSVVLGPSCLTVGHDDIEKEDNLPLTSVHEFGWDNESPRRQLHVAPFRIEWRPVSNGEYQQFLEKQAKPAALGLPASWQLIKDDIYVKTFYGPVPIHIAHHWPVILSHDELSAYARVQGGRLPTEAELRVFLDTFCSGYLGGTNLGFRNWHPIAPTTGGADDDGRGHNGGVWEWTSTVFDRYDGFIASELYPGYSADFFDGAHRVVLGGSFGTAPRLGQRRTFRNWYQHNYRYAWIGGRVAYDV